MITEYTEYFLVEVELSVIQCSSVTLRAYSILINLKYLLPQSVLIILYILLLPYLQYCAMIWVTNSVTKGTLKNPVMENSGKGGVK